MKTSSPASPTTYRPQAEDTSVETDRFEFELLRKRTAAERALMSAAIARNVKQLCLCGLRRRYPNLEDISSAVARAFLGDECPPNLHFFGSDMTWIQDSLDLAAMLHPMFEELTIPYYITGGVASSLHGDPRSTRDLDIVVWLPVETLDLLVRELEERNFYVPGVEDVRSGRMRTLGITHQESISRADFILADETEFERVKFTRRQHIDIPGKGKFWFASAEDVVLNKLRWGLRSQSEKQWRDVLGILKLQGETLDFDYLQHWAIALDLASELNRAFSQAQLP